MSEARHFTHAYAASPTARLYLYFGLDVVDGVAAFYLKGNGLACQCLDEYLHGFQDYVTCTLGSQMIFPLRPGQQIRS